MSNNNNNEIIAVDWKQKQTDQFQDILNAAFKRIIIRLVFFSVSI